MSFSSQEWGLERPHDFRDRSCQSASRSILTVLSLGVSTTCPYQFPRVPCVVLGSSFPRPALEHGKGGPQYDSYVCQSRKPGFAGVPIYDPSRLPTWADAPGSALGWHGGWRTPLEANTVT